MTRFLLAFIAAMLAMPASAQNMQLAQNPTVITTMTIAELNEMLSRNGLTGTFEGEYEDGEKISKMISAANGDATVYFSLRECEGVSETAPCSLVEAFTYFTGAGLTLSHVNAFNLEESRASIAGLLDDGQGIIATKIWLHHGVTIENLEFNIGLFFFDTDLLLANIQPGALASTDFSTTRTAAAGFADPGGALDLEWRVNAVGRNAPRFVTEEIRRNLKANGL